MRKNIPAILEAYKEELSKYKEWSNRKIQMHGEDVLGAWPLVDCNRMLAFNNTFDMIKRVLGLTEKESEKLDREVFNK